MIDESITPLVAPEQATLGYLRWHWGSAYRITRDRGCWSARRLDGLGMFTAKSGEEMLTALRLDYANRPVPRLMHDDHDHDFYGRCLPRSTGLLARFLRGQGARLITGKRKEGKTDGSES